MRLDGVKADHESVEDRVSLPFRVSLSVMPKNTQSLKMKFLWSCPQTLNNFVTQWRRITLHLFTISCPGDIIIFLHQTPIHSIQFNYSDFVDSILGNQSQS